MENTPVKCKYLKPVLIYSTLVIVLIYFPKLIFGTKNQTH